jgi:ketosteroid isomerase-like protein
MVNRLRIVGAMIFLGAAVVSCGRKDTDDKSDSAQPGATAAAGSTFDKSAEAAAIRKQDDAWTRAVQSKNLDSVMALYSPNAIAMEEGTARANGDAVRSAYAAFLKSNPRDVKQTSSDANFSDDGTVAYEHGHFSLTADGPGGKPMKVSGDYLDVWKKEGGAWKVVEEITNTAPESGK